MLYVSPITVNIILIIFWQFDENYFYTFIATENIAILLYSLCLYENIKI